MEKITEYTESQAGRLNWLPPPPPAPQASVSPQDSSGGGETHSLVGRGWGSQFRRRDYGTLYSNPFSLEKMLETKIFGLPNVLVMYCRQKSCGYRIH